MYAGVFGGAGDQEHGIAYRTKLVGVCASVPNAVQQLIVTVEVASIVGNLIVCVVRHGCEVDRDGFDCDVASCIVNQCQISEAATHVIFICGVVASFGWLEPVRFVHASILSSITADVGDPEGTLAISEPNELIFVDIADLQRDKTCNILAKVVGNSGDAIEDGLTASTPNE